MIADIPLVAPPPLLEAYRRSHAHRLCAECRGRLFGRWGHGWTNPERDAELARRAQATEPAADPAECELCRGVFGRIDRWVERAVAAAEGVEFGRFSCGSRWEPEQLAAEEWLWAEVGTSWAESLRSAFNREWGKAVAARTGAEADPAHPDVVFLADLPVGRVERTIRPLYLRGRYRKFDRTLPQTRWPCRRCRGRGCVDCGGSGKTYPTSVEELVAAAPAAAAGADATRFHGMGREDIDARMLGRGRPFVLELRNPHRRHLDTDALREEVNRAAAGRVELVSLGPASAEDVLWVKEAAPDKSYRVTFRGAVAGQKVKEALTLVPGRAIRQRTPTRVLHRRSDRVRPRRIVRVELVSEEPGRFTLELRAESGTYVKEWVEGDGGRTEPSLADLVGVPLRVESLDVLEVHDEEGR